MAEKSILKITEQIIATSKGQFNTNRGNKPEESHMTASPFSPPASG